MYVGRTYKSSLLSIQISRTRNTELKLTKAITYYVEQEGGERRGGSGLNLI